MVKKALSALGAAVLVPPMALVMFIVVIAGDDSSNESKSSGKVTSVPTSTSSTYGKQGSCATS